MRFGCADARRLLLEREDARPVAADARALDVHLATCLPCRRAATSLATAMAELRVWLDEHEAAGRRSPERAPSAIRSLWGPAGSMALAAAACLALMGPARAPETEGPAFAYAATDTAQVLSWLDAEADEPRWELPEP